MKKIRQEGNENFHKNIVQHWSVDISNPTAKTVHPVQKLRDNLDKYPRTFDSCFLSYMIDTYIKTLKK
jgi:SMC interacting uncharacterized protein involved in chromosome segregation